MKVVYAADVEGMRREKNQHAEGNRRNIVMKMFNLFNIFSRKLSPDTHNVCMPI